MKELTHADTCNAIHRFADGNESLEIWLLEVYSVFIDEALTAVQDQLLSDFFLSKLSKI